MPIMGGSLKWGKVTSGILRQLEAIVGADDVLLGKETIVDYTHDESSVEPHTPEVVVRAETSEEVSQLLALANRERLPVTPRGGGTGLCGSSIPIHGGILLSLEKMNHILELDGIFFISAYCHDRFCELKFLFFSLVSDYKKRHCIVIQN